MKYLVLPAFALIFLMVLPEKSEGQGRAPVYGSNSMTQPRPISRSQPPGGSRRPLTLTRRQMAMQQFGWEIGGNFGSSYSLTDASGTSIDRRASFLNTQWSTMSVNAGVFGRYKFHELYAIKASFNYGRVHGADSIAGRARNFFFHNNIFELAVLYEVYIPKRSPLFPFNFYGFVGMAAFYHYPSLTVPEPPPFDFTWDEYNKIQPAIPIGFGFNYSVTREFKIGYEIGWRKTFFDYLDGFTRPWSRGSDSYYFGTVKLSYYFPRQMTQQRRW